MNISDKENNLEDIKGEKRTLYIGEQDKKSTDSHQKQRNPKDHGIISLICYGGKNLSFYIQHEKYSKMKVK